jgi:hypothetical protein
LSNNQGILRAYILIISQEPIRDPEKNPLPEELKVVRVGGIGLYKELAYLKKKAKHIKSDNPKIFTDILINPEILIIEHKFELT